MRYTIKTDKWDTKLPRMTEDRINHSSCFVNSRLYVIGGLVSQEPEQGYYNEAACKKQKSSIEWLDVDKSGARWQLIQLPEEQHGLFDAQFRACSLMGSRILIFGFNNHEQREFTPFLFDCTTEVLS